jgi:UDP-GlcNAc:undecaprenyl-phosphate GlcNAc-1-phosphate transferase
MGIPFTIIAVVLVINAINLIDGLDGLAGGLGLIITFWLAVCSIAAGDSGNLMVTSIFAGALIGFLNYNLRHRFRERASVFLGNSGKVGSDVGLAHY